MSTRQHKTVIPEKWETIEVSFVIAQGRKCFWAAAPGPVIQAELRKLPATQKQSRRESRGLRCLDCTG